MPINLTHTDCITGTNTLPSESIDVIVTSPPYNIGVKYNTYNDNIPRNTYLTWTLDWARATYRVLKPNGSMFVVIGSKPSDTMVPEFALIQFLRASFTLQNRIIWVKSVALEIDTTTFAFGHYKPINSDRYVNDCYEFIFHLTKTGNVPLDRLAIGVPYADKSNIKRWNKSEDLRCRGNTWFIPYTTIQNSSAERPHPATFPERIPEYCLRLHGLSRITSVLDPFVGSGTTALVCKQLGLDFIGFDIDRDYITQAQTRVT